MVWPICDGTVHPVRDPSLDGNLALTNNRALAKKHDSSLRVYLTRDLPEVYEDNFMSTANPDGNHFHPTLILVSTRLGIDKINPIYHEALISTLQLPQAIGIAG